VGKWTPCKRGDFILRLQQLGFDGPLSGAKHQFLVYKTYRLAIPSNTEYSVPQLRMMIREIEEILGHEVAVDEWNRL
jgi:hypothetical protein